MASRDETVSMRHPTSVRSALAFPFIVWLVWRTAHAVLLVVLGGDLAGDAFRFDGGWFLNLLDTGYDLRDPSFTTQQNVAFFPGLVWVTEPFSWLLGNRSSAILVANATGVTAFLAVYATTKLVLDERAARRTLIALAVWPASITMTAYYSEGLFLTATAIAIGGAGSERHALGWVGAFVAGVTRSIGVLLGPILAVVRAVRLRRIDRVTVAYAVSGPIGLGIVAMTQRAQVDDPLAFARAQEGWDRTLAAPWEPFSRATTGIVDKLPSLALELGLNLVAMILVGLALITLTRRHRRDRSTWAFLAWGWAGWFAPLCTAVPSSQVRFAIAAWPAFAVVATRERRWTRAATALGLAACLVISAVLVHRWVDGDFIG